MKANREKQTQTNKPLSKVALSFTAMVGTSLAGWGVLMGGYWSVGPYWVCGLNNHWVDAGQENPNCNCDYCAFTTQKNLE